MELTLQYDDTTRIDSILIKQLLPNFFITLTKYMNSNYIGTFEIITFGNRYCALNYTLSELLIGRLDN